MKLKLQLFRDAAGEWRWRFVGRNGRIVATSGEGFKGPSGASRAAIGFAERLIEQVQTHGELMAEKIDG